MFLLSGTRIIPGTLSGIATTKNSKSKGNGAGGVGGNRLIFRYYRPVSAEGGSYLSGLDWPPESPDNQYHLNK